LQLSELLGQKLLARNWRVATAESCTGGGIAAAITAVAGSSAWFEYGVVSYANRAKQTLLKVDSETIAHDGAVSKAVVEQMVAGVLALSDADIAVAVSGIAGPSGGTSEKPVGTIWFAWGLASGEIYSDVFHFSGDRHSVQEQSVVQGIVGLLKLL
jgi:nicotinamide-nucleotide amidase